MEQKSLTVLSVRRIRGRAVLTLSDGSVLQMPRAMLKERPYRSGMPFDKLAFFTFLRDRSYPFAMEKAVSLLAMRSRTEKELRDGLAQNAYPEGIIERVIARMGEAGYIDDASFAAQWTLARSGKGMGTRRIAMELRQKGVSQETIETTLSSLEEDSITESALAAARRAARGKDLSSRVDRQKIIAALARRGFDYQQARHAIASLQDEGD